MAKVQAWQLKMIVKELLKYYENAKQTEKTILNCAIAAAVANAVGGFIPVLSIPALIISCFGALWVMYGMLCHDLGIVIKESVLKLLARAILSNIVANLGGAIIAVLASLVVPGASVVVSTVVSFITLYIAGTIFLHLILRMAQKSVDPVSFSDITPNEMKNMAQEITPTKDMLDEAKKAYEENKDKMEKDDKDKDSNKN